MELSFCGGQEYVILDIDRKNKKLKISSSQTGYKSVPLEWKALFDKGKEKLQEAVTDKLNDKMFIEAIKQSMNQAGYEPIKTKC